MASRLQERDFLTLTPNYFWDRKSSLQPSHERPTAISTPDQHSLSNKTALLIK